MGKERTRNRALGSVVSRSRGFTLIELLTVIAIIGLLIGLLVPSLAKARDSAKTVKTRAAMKSLGDGLEMFRSENDDEIKGGGYPSSKADDDPTDKADHTAYGSEDLFGCQWLVRYLVGKKQDGYVAKASVPKQYWGKNPYDQQLGWYDAPGDPDFPKDATEPFGRSGPYVTPDAIKVKAPKELAGSPVDLTDTTPKYNNLVFVDAFGFPILYYAANTAHSALGNANPASYLGYECTGGVCTGYPGVFTYKDDALFTGLCKEGGVCDKDFPPWDFGSGKHKLDGGPWDVSAPASWKDVIAKYPHSFAYYVMNKNVYQSSDQKTVVAVRKDSFILITPGKDGLFGTSDDITNY